MSKQSRGHDLVLRGWRGGLPRPWVLPPDPRSWVIGGQGACRQLTLQELAAGAFDIDDSADDPQGAAFAKSVCAGCPVRGRCLELGLANEPYGIYGGLDARERRELRGSALPSYEERQEAARIRRMFAQGRTAAEVAAVYKVSRRTIERWRSKAGLTVTRQVPRAA